MRYAFISDIHGNLEALEAVLDELTRSAPDRVICLGDIVGYGANPAECVRLLREKGISCIAGNHDYAAAGRIATEYFNYEAQCSIAWTQAALSAEEKEFLAEIPLTLRDDRFLCFHGALPNPAAFEYILTPRDAALCFQALDAEIGVCGHTHVPWKAIESEDSPALQPLDTLALDDGCRCLINVGSVGQPRDGEPLACIFHFDSERRSGRLERVAYDVGTAARKILAAGLPEINAYRLLVGR